MKGPPVILCVLSFQYGFCHEIMRGVHRFVGRVPSGPLFHPVGETLALHDFIEDQSIAGAIGFLAGPVFERNPIPDDFRALNISNLSRVTFPSITNDDHLAGYKAGQVIAGTRPAAALIIADTYGDHQIDRRDGARVAFQEAGIPCADYRLRRTASVNLSKNRLWIEAVIRELKQVFSSHRDNLPLAIVCADYVIAELVAVVVRREQLDIPGDIRIIGVGKPGDRIVPIGRPDVSTIPLDWERLGEEVAALMTDWVLNGKRPPQRSTIPPLDPVIRASTRTSVDSVVDQTQAIVEERKDYALTIEEIAGQLGITVATLIRRFKRECSTTPKEMLVRWRIEEAKRLLRETQLDIAGVAARCGYADHSTFSAAFRSRIGKTPSQWRRDVGV